jgi:hypothetical protein
MLDQFERKVYALDGPEKRREALLGSNRSRDIRARNDASASRGRPLSGPPPIPPRQDVVSFRCLRKSQGVWGTESPRSEVAKTKPGKFRFRLGRDGDGFSRSRGAHWAQTTKASIFSLGVIHPKHFRGRSLRNVSMRLRCAVVIFANEDLLGCSLRMSPLVFSLVPRSQE